MITTTTRQESHQHQDTFKIVENTANKIECTKILEKVDECRYEMTTAASQADDYIQSAQDYNRGLYRHKTRLFSNTNAHAFLYRATEQIK
jgi:isopentenyl diphosphate isomerase/L-lactate dehydrogenase-like FMN-dependent dehydrogenase